MSINIGPRHVAPFFINQTDLLAGTAFDIPSPADGYLTDIVTAVQTPVTTGGTVKAQIATVDVAGAVVTIANGAVKGTVQSATATKGSATRKVAKGDRISIKPTSFATAGAVNGHIVISSSLPAEEAL